MLAHKLIPPLIGVAALLLAASVALAVVLLTSGNGNDSPQTTPVVEVATATATNTPLPVPSATPGIALSPELSARIDALPGKLRSEVLNLIEQDRITLPELQTLLDDYANRNPHLLIGSVVDSKPDSLTLTVYATGEQATVAVTPETVVHGVNNSLHPDELVLVVTTDDGKAAKSITGFGVQAP